MYKITFLDDILRINITIWILESESLLLPTAANRQNDLKTHPGPDRQR